jgi:hypothetical protein
VAPWSATWQLKEADGSLSDDRLTMLHLPADHEVVAGMIVGYPRVRYHRGIRRPLAGITWV